jgi:hypothetical protein
MDPAAAGTTAAIVGLRRERHAEVDHAVLRRRAGRLQQPGNVFGLQQLIGTA